MMDKKTKFGEETIMHLAMKNGHVHVILMLLELHDCNQVFKMGDAMGNNPIHSLTFNVTCTHAEFEEIFELLNLNQPSGVLDMSEEEINDN